MDTRSTNGRGIDADKQRRPGVPEERAHAPAGNAHWATPAKQTATTEIIKDATRDQLTATFGTGPGPGGLSGILRRAAYRLPDYEAKRWALLLFADRVDALEDRVLGFPKSPAAWVTLAGATALAVWGWLGGSAGGSPSADRSSVAPPRPSGRRDEVRHGLPPSLLSTIDRGAIRKFVR